jgi:hypothetical protein
MRKPWRRIRNDATRNGICMMHIPSPHGSVWKVAGRTPILPAALFCAFAYVHAADERESAPDQI